MNINLIMAQFDLQTSWFLHALDNISEGKSNTIYSANLNSIRWVAGHLTDARMTIISIVSGNILNEDYKKYFGKGTNNKFDHTTPNIEQIKAEWIKTSKNLKAAIQSMSEEQLLSKPPFQTSIPDETFIGLIAYFVIHESFHIGQLSIYRKLSGKEAMSMGRI